MRQIPGTLTIEHRDGRVILQGEIDMATVDDLRSNVEAACTGGQVVPVDVSQVQFVDSTGLGALIGLAKRCRAANGDMRLVGVTPQIRKLLTITGTASFFELED